MFLCLRLQPSTGPNKVSIVFSGGLEKPAAEVTKKLWYELSKYLPLQQIYKICFNL